MGNKKANSYWEAELPPNYERVGIENFIRAKYKEKRWIPWDKKSTSISKVLEEISSEFRQKPGDRGAHGSANNVNSPEKQNTVPPQNSRKDNLVVPKIPSLSNMVSPYAIHQQQQALLMAAAKFGSAPSRYPGKTHQPGGTDSQAPYRNLPAQSWPNLGYQVPGMSPLAGQPNSNMLNQIGNISHAHPSGNFSPLPTSRRSEEKFFIFFPFYHSQPITR